jgi:hypothetical protein
MGLEFAGELGAGAIPFFQPIGRDELVPAGGRCATGRGCERDRGLQLFSGVAPSRNIETGEWSVSDRRNRAISVLSQETVSEWLENKSRKKQSGVLPIKRSHKTAIQTKRDAPEEKLIF